MTFEELTLTNGDVRVGLVPARGAIVSSLTVRGQDVLFLDRATLDDPSKNVRGGIPILFPFAGKLPDERFVAKGTAMKQHGFGRNKPWSVDEARPDSARLVLGPDPDTRAQFPYELEVAYGVRTLARGVQVELTVANTGAEPLPLSPGWHPYFRCPAARKSQVTGDVAGFTPDKLGDDREFDFGVEAPRDGRARFTIPELGVVRLEFSPTLRHLQFWSQPAKSFICLEPFFGPANTINTERRFLVPPGQARDFWMRIELI